MAEEGYAEQVRSLLLPISEYNLLLPGTVVAEVVSYEDPSPIKDQGEENPWLLGLVSWRGQRVPLVALEGFLAGELGRPGSRSRIAILKAVGNRPGMPYFGLLTQQIPRLVSVYPDTIESLEEEGAGDYPGVYSQVLVTGEPALIPDIEGIESALYTKLYH